MTAVPWADLSCLKAALGCTCPLKYDERQQEVSVISSLSDKLKKQGVASISISAKKHTAEKHTAKTHTAGKKQ